MSLAIYLHVPFCTVKCAYCDFNSYAGLDDLTDQWEAAARRELELWSPRAAGREIATIFIGGGTPSLLEGDAIARLLATIEERYRVADDAEITLEANPESVDPRRMSAYRAAGVNRISMGVQSLDSGELQFLDRLHSGERARAAFEEIRSAGFDNLNLDLIYGLPGQTLATWQRSLEGVLGWGSDGRGPDHLSCYALTVEDGTPLAARVASGLVREADSDEVAAMADWTAAQLSGAGYEQYETSNYARPERACRHNLVYWRHQEYIGVGPGAHGFVDGVRYAVVRRPRAYIDRLLGGRAPSDAAAGLPSPAVDDAEMVSDRDVVVDTLTLGLRLTEGVDEASLRARCPDAYADVAPAIDWAIGSGLATRGGGNDQRLLLTARGRALANEVFVRLVEPSLV